MELYNESIARDPAAYAYKADSYESFMVRQITILIASIMLLKLQLKFSLVKFYLSINVFREIFKLISVFDSKEKASEMTKNSSSDLK